MAYIGKIVVTDEWEKLEDLIKDQVSGQSAFAFDTSKTYNLQVETTRGQFVFGVRLCNSTTEPANADDGEHLEAENMAMYQPESGVYLWVKNRDANTSIKMSISEQ